MPILLGNIAHMPIRDSRVFALGNQQGQAAQIHATSTDVARPPTGTLSPANTAVSATLASPTITGSQVSTSSFAAKGKDKATRHRPRLTVNTNLSNKSTPTSAASSSAYGQPSNENDEYGSSEVGEGFKTRPGSKDPLSLNLLEFHEASTPTTEPSSSFMSPTTLAKALRRNFAKLSATTGTTSNTRAGKERAGESARELEAELKMEREEFVAFKVSYQFVLNDYSYTDSRARSPSFGSRLEARSSGMHQTICAACIQTTIERGTRRTSGVPCTMIPIIKSTVMRVQIAAPRVAR